MADMLRDIRVILQAGAYDLFRLGFQSFRLWSRNDVMWLLSQIMNSSMSRAT